VLQDANEASGTPLSAPAVVLLTGRVRPLDRDSFLSRYRDRIKAQRDRGQPHDRPLFVVATQTVEVGADVDFDALVTEVAPLDALRQRFGRLDRLGRLGTTRAAVFARKDAMADRTGDPVYGQAPSETWKWLFEQAAKPRARGADPALDFGFNALEARLPADPQARARRLEPLLAETPRAPVVLPAHLDAWVQTDPIPEPDPEVGVFLHGPAREADIQVVWRADLTEENEQLWVDVVSLLPPSSLEAMPVPLPAVRSWLSRVGQAADVSDVEGAAIPSEGGSRRGSSRGARSTLRWRGPDDSERVTGDGLYPGDTIVVPSSYGGADEFGWKPGSEVPVSDLGDLASLCGRNRPALRLHSGVIASWASGRSVAERQQLAGRVTSWLAGAGGSDDDEVRLDRGRLPALIATLGEQPGLPSWVGAVIAPWKDPAVRPTLETPYPSGAPCPWLLLGSRIRVPASVCTDLGEDGDATSVADGSSEDDSLSFLGSEKPVTLDEHLKAVAAQVEKFARSVGLPDRHVQLLNRAGLIHDAGKGDFRFQTWLYGGDDIAALSGETLAKSGRDPTWPESRRAHRLARLPDGFRHEAVSVALAMSDPTFLSDLDDEERDLVLHLAGTHHGRGRPFWPVVRDTANPLVTHTLDGHTLTAPARHGLERLDSGWTDRFWRLVRRYGPWGLALMEATLILADHHCSRTESEDRR
jgi:CRISPR-associated endonuclease/helicase Cas3